MKNRLSLPVSQSIWNPILFVRYFNRYFIKFQPLPTQKSFCPLRAPMVSQTSLSLRAKSFLYESVCNFQLFVSRHLPSSLLSAWRVYIIEATSSLCIQTDFKKQSHLNESVQVALFLFSCPPYAYTVRALCRMTAISARLIWALGRRRLWLSPFTIPCWMRAAKAGRCAAGTCPPSA